MDKETEEHLKEYKKHISEYKEKIISCENLIDEILKSEEVDLPAQHDFPNFAKYNRGTDI